jgi:hypothetical protein
VIISRKILRDTFVVSLIVCTIVLVMLYLGLIVGRIPFRVNFLLIFASYWVVFLIWIGSALEYVQIQNKKWVGCAYIHDLSSY